MARPLGEITRDARMWASRVLNRSLAPPDWLSVNVTLRCNLSCVMCTTCYDSPELSARELMDLVDQAADWGVRVFNPLGGEPFVRPDLEDILAHAARRDMHVTLTTNATLIKPERAARIATIPPEKLHVNISLDGPEPIHDQVRGPGSFKRAMAGYQALREADEALGNPHRKVCANAILHRENAAGFADFVDWLGEQGFHGVQVLNLFRNRDDDMVGGMWFRPEDMPALDAAISAISGHPLVLNRPDDLALVPRYYREGLSPLDAPCWAGWKELYVNADGQAMMCDGKLDFLAGRFGSVREQTLRQLWESEALRARREVVKACTTPCIQNCYLRRDSDSIVALAREAIRVAAPPRRRVDALVLEASDVPSDPSSPLLRRMFARSPVGYEAVVADPRRLAELRDLRYLDTSRGFLGAAAAARILDNVGRVETLYLGWRGETLLHPELDALLDAVAARAGRVIVPSSGRIAAGGIFRHRANVSVVEGVELPEVTTISWEGRVTRSPTDTRLRAMLGDALKEDFGVVLARR
ncbi:MAG: radical SAM protein [Deltaproteobacteria bacterium]|nr:radical SAM protein [Deltaproteobacteria bacterium]